MAQLGIATPVGAAGVSLDWIPIRYLAVEAGVGSNFEGPELEAGARLRLPVFSDAYLTFGSGFCVAHYTGHETNGLGGFSRIFEGIAEGSFSYAVWQHAQFWNNELGVEGGTTHFLARYYLGYATLLNRSAYSCTAGDFKCKPEASNGLWYAGVAIGYAL